jgi:hemerythrin-like metal-binding protein
MSVPDLAPPEQAAPQPLKWDAAFDIGHPAIDDQHRQLVELANRLLEHPEATMHDEAVVDILTKLGNSLDEHFRSEEAIMGRFGMPATLLAEHVRAHNRILDQYAEFNIAAAAGASYRAADIYAKVLDWVGHHMVEHDLLIKDYLPAA